MTAVATRPEERTGSDVKELRGFDDYVRRLMRDWKVQGLGVAIARGDEIIYSRGFGLRDVEHDFPVTPHSIFAIGSTTKTFTTAALALLADEGKFDWDAPIREYLPTFRLWDAFAGDRMTGKDLTCHRSGLPRHDLMWYGSDESRRELFDRLRYLQPTADFRTVWQYQNLMYMTAGYLVEVLSGLTWEEFVRERIFGPLGMASSHIDASEIETSPDFSRGYREKKNKVEVMDFYRGFKAMAPAGSIFSSITDMSQWLLVQLNGGKLAGSPVPGRDRQFLSDGQIRLMHTPHMFIAKGQYPELPYSSYGLGWFVEPYRGHDMIHHGGNIDGFSSMFSLLPEAGQPVSGNGVGVVVLTNMDGTPVRDMIPYNVFDRFIDGKAVPWNARLKAQRKELREGERRGKQKRQEDRVRGTRPSHKLEAYAGTYRHPGYGPIRIELDDGKLKAVYNNLELEFSHYHYDVFQMTLERFDFQMLVSFGTDKRGAIGTLSAPLEATLNDIVFERQPDESLTDPTFLGQFTGTYELMGNLIVIELVGDALHATVPGLPPQELVPIKGTEFGLKAISAVSLEFKRDRNGAVSEVLVNQAGVVLTAKKTAD
jgi:CubicO group peptidase (beta-lactamase class C family)